LADQQQISVSPVNDKAALKAFVDIAYDLNASDPAWVPPLRAEVYEMFNPAKNPFYGHATVQPMIARRDGKVVGRISAHIDHLALTQPVEQGMGPGTGNFGMFEAADEAVARALLNAAEQWLRDQGMTRALGPLSLSIWDEPGLLTFGHDRPPIIMMGHHNRAYQGWIERAGYTPAKKLLSYELPIVEGFSPLVQRIVAAGRKNERIRLRKVDKSRFDEDAATILAILNDAWGENWGFVPITDAEVAYIGKKLRPLVREDLIMIAEYDGRPVAFLMTLPDINTVTAPLNGSLFPFGWAKLLWWLRTCRSPSVRVPLMGVVKDLQNTRMAAQLAFMLIETIRVEAVKNYGTVRGEIGWVLEDNQGMNAIADAIESKVNREYLIYEKPL
jgi:GNAT superfamily N-acetyltransferase|tara:strand:+ start:149380 stop:150540 length:1161 start_codon:yes stop_codon:yes gene_type:complete